MKPLPKFLKPYDEAIKGKTISHFLLHSDTTLLVFTDGTAVHMRHYDDGDEVSSRFATDNAGSLEKAQVADYLRLAGYMEQSDVDAYRAEHHAKAAERQLAEERALYKRLKAKFEATP